MLQYICTQSIYISVSYKYRHQWKALRSDASTARWL